MARATFVKCARKDNPNAGIKKGESYYWWKFRFGGKHYSKKAPKGSQLTQSEFMSSMLSTLESLEELGEDSTVEDIRSAVESAVSDLESLRDETQEKFDNMPESLQGGPTGELLESRVEGCDEVISELEAIDFSDAEAEEEEAEAKEAAGEDAVTDAKTDLLSEVGGVCYNGE